MNDLVYFFNGWPALGRILVVGTLTYVTLIVLLRLSGSRSLASMNAFDFVVTVAIGAVFGRTLTAKGVALAEAVTALALLLGLQFCVAWVQKRSTAFEDLITNAPTLLYFRGRFIRPSMRRARVTEADLQGAVRKKQIGSMKEVEAIVLEPTGQFSIIKSIGDGSAFGHRIQEQIRGADGR